VGGVLAFDVKTKSHFCGTGNKKESISFIFFHLKRKPLKISLTI